MCEWVRGLVEAEGGECTHLQLLGMLSFPGSKQPGLELWNGTAFACTSR